MNDVMVKGQRYRLGKMVAVKQLHVARKLMPIMAQLGTIAKAMAPLENAVTAMPTVTGAAFAAMPAADQSPAANPLLKLDLTELTPVAQALAGLPDADVDFVVYSALAVVMRAMPGDSGWVPVLGQNNVIMFDDIDMIAMLNLVGQVVWGNLRGFMPAPAQIS